MTVASFIKAVVTGWSLCKMYVLRTVAERSRNIKADFSVSFTTTGMRSSLTPFHPFYHPSIPPDHPSRPPMPAFS